MKTLTVYHGDSCIDGLTSAWLSTVAAGQAGEEEPELYPLTYREGQETALAQHIVDNYVKGKYYDTILILDISLTLAALENLTKISNARIIMLDHHKTAFDRYIPNKPRTKYEKRNLNLHNLRVYIALNNGMSGAGMTHMYFFPDTEAPLLVQHVQDRDIWSYDMIHTKAIDQFLKKQKQTIENWTDINARMCHATGYEEVVQKGKQLLADHEANVLDLAHTSTWVTLNGAKGLMVRCGYEYASDVGHELCKESSTYGLTYFSIADENTGCLNKGMLQVSLRSEEDYDVEVIAKKYGGGGHKNASGFIIDANLFFSGALA